MWYFLAHQVYKLKYIYILQWFSSSLYYILTLYLICKPVDFSFTYSLYWVYQGWWYASLHCYLSSKTDKKLSSRQYRFGTELSDLKNLRIVSFHDSFFWWWYIVSYRRGRGSFWFIYVHIERKEHGCLAVRRRMWYAYICQAMGLMLFLIFHCQNFKELSITQRCTCCSHLKKRFGSSWPIRILEFRT